MELNPAEKNNQGKGAQGQQKLPLSLASGTM
jgi:hypothetical protein